MAEGFHGDGLATELFAAYRTIHDLVIAAAFCAGGGGLILGHRFCGDVLITGFIRKCGNPHAACQHEQRKQQRQSSLSHFLRVLLNHHVSHPPKSDSNKRIEYVYTVNDLHQIMQ